MKSLRKMWAWTWSLIGSPYATAETIAADGDPLPGLALFAILTAGAMSLHSGALSALAHSGRGWEGRYFVLQCLVSLVGLALGAAAITLAVRICGGETTWRRVLAFWTFSYLPTAIFFAGGFCGLIVLTKFFGSLRAVPQPIQFIGLFFAALMLFWKIWLLLTTLRVVGNLTLAGVIKACLGLVVVVALYWWALQALRLQWIPYI